MLEAINRPAENLTLARWTQTVRPSTLSECLELASRPGLLSLALGLPAPDLFPAQDFFAAALRTLDSDPCALQYGPPLLSLKRHVVSLMSLRGVACTERQVFLTAGAQQALNLLARVLLNQHDEVVVEDLTYPGLHQVLEPYQPRVLTVPTDAQTGIDVDALEALLEGGARPAFVYVISNGHNPLGVEMAAAKRSRLVELAGRYHVPIIEDDPYGHLYYDDAPPPPLRALDDQWVLYVGSFSKILAPALRIGWAVVPEWVTHKLATVKEATDLNTTTFSQRAVSNYLDTGALPAHIARLRREYRSRRDAMLGALEDCLRGDARWNEPRCGFFIWVELPPDADAGQLLREAVETERVAFVPGFAFGVTGDRLGSNCLRLSFSNCPTKVIEEGVHRLARVLRTGGRVFAPAGGRTVGLAPTLSS